jgi:hypothetical protein
LTRVGLAVSATELLLDMERQQAHGQQQVERRKAKMMNLKFFD